VETTQSISKQNSKSADSVVLQAECDPSLKEDMRACLIEAGFSSQSDCLKTLVRDFVSGRINYRGGVLRSQAQIS